MIAWIRKQLAEMFFENVGLKIVSLLCAIGFFAFVRGSERSEIRFSVDVSHEDPPEEAGRILVKEPPSTLSVTLRGPRAQLDGLPRDLGVLRLDLSDGSQSMIELGAPMIPNVPPGIEVVQIVPSRIEVRWDDVISREIQVQVKRTGESKPGTTVGPINLSPESVVATGPAQIVNLLKIVNAEPFDVSDLEPGIEERYLLLDFPPQSVTFSAPTVQAIVRIEREEDSITFKSVRVEVVGAPKGSTRPETVSVRVRGGVELVSNLDTEQLVPRVEIPADVDVAKRGSRMLPVILDLPGLTVDVEPKQVLVKW